MSSLEGWPAMREGAVPPTATRWVLRVLVVGYLFLLVIWPVLLVARATFANGLAPVINALRQPEVIFAFQLTLSAAFWAVVINTIFGVGISLLLVRYTFPGRRALNAMVDLPLSVSPVVVGLALVLVYSGPAGWARAWNRPDCRSSMPRQGSSWPRPSLACHSSSVKSFRYYRRLEPSR